jgi:radical SAM superfamily enzyme YgiQ (UPF0313 family)
MKKFNPTDEKILLILLPFWDPQIPPSGISCLKSFLQEHGFFVKAVNANVETGLNEIYHQYHDLLKLSIPADRMGNFYKIGYDVLRHHTMAYLNYENEKEYIETVKSVIYHTFYVKVKDQQVLELHHIIRRFYARLKKYLVHLLDKEKPTLLGISAYSGTLPSSLFAFKLTKQRYPGIKTVIGGGIFADLLAPGSPNLQIFLEKTPYIDNIIIGEGELLLLELLRAEPAKAQRVYTLKDINNEILNLSSLPIPDFSDFDLNYYTSLFAFSSRSCPYQCRFCSETLQWGKYRKKSGQQVARELLQLYRKHGMQLFMMGDSLLNPTISDIASQLVKEDASVYWDGYLRVDKHACNKEQTLEWRRGGFYRARLGVESGSQRVLDLMDKKITVEQTRTALSSLAHAGIKTTTYWVVGFPGETEADFQETLDLVEEIADDIYEADCSPFWFFLTNQPGAGEWQKKSIPLYPGKTGDLLMLQTWMVDCQPNREEIHRRMWRFVQHCDRLGIPNPYSLRDIYKADERWQKLHRNAVPPLVDFKNTDIRIDENKYLKSELLTANVPQDDGDFEF